MKALQRRLEIVIAHLSDPTSSRSAALQALKEALAITEAIGEALPLRTGGDFHWPSQRTRLARSLYAMFEQRTGIDWQKVDDSFPAMRKEWLDSADELLARMGWDGVGSLDGENENQP
jgi:hypothetical protein